MNARKGAKVRVNALAYANLIKLLHEGGYTSVELANRSGLAPRTVQRTTYELWRVGMVHIGEWEGAFRCFQLGPGKDVPRPLSTSTERARRSRQRARQLGILHKIANTRQITMVIDQVSQL